MKYKAEHTTDFMLTQAAAGDGYFELTFGKQPVLSVTIMPSPGIHDRPTRRIVWRRGNAVITRTSAQIALDHWAGHISAGRTG